MIATGTAIPAFETFLGRTTGYGFSFQFPCHWLADSTSNVPSLKYLLNRVVAMVQWNQSTDFNILRSRLGQRRLTFFRRDHPYLMIYVGIRWPIIDFPHSLPMAIDVL
jgi:hypothetical protein